MLGLKPDEFWRLSLAEFNDMVEGYNLRTEREMHLLAWHAANIMNVHLKRKVTVKKLLGKGKIMTFESKEQQFNKLMDLLKQKGAS